MARSFHHRTANGLGLAVVLTALSAPSAPGQDLGGDGWRAEAASPASTAGAAEAAYVGSVGSIQVRTPHVGSPGIEVDGRLDEPEWDAAARLEGFTQYDPVEGRPATQRTEVRVFRSDEALYFGIRAHDDEPEAIRAVLSQRDKHSGSNDYVRILLDTFDDQRRAYAFTVNPLGVQEDGLWIEGGSRRGFGDPIDTNPDFVWDSEGSVHDWGYSVELRIPFEGLRFRSAPRQDWGLQVVRRIYRNGFEASWAPVTADRANKLSQMGKLRSLQGLDPGVFLEFNPEVTARRVGLEDASGQFGYQDPSGELGLNVTYGVTSNLRLDATYNPDFSQVEADAGQIAVNERFAQFFPEARPFFLEGTEIFHLPQQLVYTRTIAQPVTGAKLTGKIGATNVGYLGAIDRTADGGRTLVTLVRARQDMGGSSTVGLTLTDRTTSGSVYNRVAGADARLVLGGRYTLDVMGAGSRTGDGGARDLSGSLLHATVRKSGRTFTWNGGLEAVDADFRAGSGFIRRVGDAKLSGEARYNFWGKPGALVERVSPSLELEGFWNHDDFWAGGRPKEGQVQARVWASLRGNSSAYVSLSREFFDFDASRYEGLRVGDPSGPTTAFRPDPSIFEGMLGVRTGIRVGGSGSLRGDAGFGIKETPIFDRAHGVPVEPAREISADAELTWVPTRSLSLEASVRHLRLDRTSDGSRYSTATIPRLRVQYQFTKSLYARVIGEYAAQESGQLRDPATGLPLSSCDGDRCEIRTGRTSNTISGEALVAYEPSPGTVLYLGFTRQMSEISAFRFQRLEPVAEGLFAKVSYRFRL